MLSFYPSAAHSYHSTAHPLYSDDIIHLHPSISGYSYRPRTTNPESRYRRALSEYLAAEEELLRSREEATSRARAEAFQRQEVARLLQAQIIRARKVREARRLEQVLAQQHAAALAAKSTVPQVRFSLPDIVPVACSVPEQRRNSTPVNEEGQRDAPRLVPENETSAAAPTLESLLQARLRKVASGNEDEEMQDLARATLHHLAQHTPDATSALSSEQTKLDTVTPVTCDTDLSRSDALQGTAAEAAKASFKAHRAAVDEQAASPVSKTAASPLEAIQDIRLTLSKISADFSIPPSLDFSDDEADGLAYTPTNAPIRAYEQALERLLSQLDAIESDGDEEVREARRTAVKEVEMALEGVEKKIRRAREAEDNSKPVLAEAIESSSDDEDVYTPTESVTSAKTEEEEDPSSTLSHATTASFSGLPPMSQPEADTASYADDSADVLPGITAIEDNSPTSDAEESTEVAATRPATVQGEVASVYTGDVPESAYSVTPEQLIPSHGPFISITSESHEEAVSPSTEGFVLTSTPVSPAFPSPALLEDVSGSHVSALPIPEGEAAVPDAADSEEEWSEVEA